MTDSIEKHFQNLFEGLPVMQVLTAFPNGVPLVAECNRHFTEVLGFTRSEVIGRPLSDFYSLTSGKLLHNDGGYTHSLQDEFLVEERELVTKDGRIIPTLLRAVPLTNEEGEVTGTQAVFVDISARKRVEQQLTYQALLLQNMSDAVIGVDLNQVITSWNKAAEQTYGWTAEEALGQTVADLLQTEFEDGFRLEDLITCLQQGKTWQGELRQRHRDGRQIFIQASTSVLVDAESHSIGAVSINRDVTEQRLAALALQESEQRFRSLIEGATVGVLIADPNGRISLVNAKMEEMFGYERQELEGQLAEILLPERFIQGHMGQRRSYLADPRIRVMGIGRELFGRCKNGEELPIEVGLNYIDEKGQLYTVAYIMDITMRRNHETMMQASLQEKEVLLQEIHHRVKNNLQVVSSLLSLQADYSADANSRKILHESQQRVQTMALIHEKLYRSANLKQVDFAEYMEGLLAYLWQSLGRKTDHVQLLTDIAPLALDVETAVPCGLILNELISNAVKHAFPQEQSGTLIIRLHLDETNQDAYLTVSDDGVGLPPNFDWNKGRSLGLMLVKALVQQLRGNVVLETAVGTTFIITFKWRKSL